MGIGAYVPATQREGPACVYKAYIILMEEGQVADDANPDKQRRGAQEDAADIIAGQVLRVGAVSAPFSQPFQGMWPQAGTGRYRGPGSRRSCQCPGSGVGRTHLGFDANLHDCTRDGEHIAGDQQNIPAIDKFQPLPQADDLSPLAPHETDKLLQEAGGVRASPGTGALCHPPALVAPELGNAGLGTRDTRVALTFCSRKPRSRERAQSRKEREQVRITTTSNRSRKLLSPVGRGPWVGLGWLQGLRGQGWGWARPRRL